jgi:hypothetical protein
LLTVDRPDLHAAWWDALKNGIVRLCRLHVSRMTQQNAATACAYMLMALLHDGAVLFGIRAAVLSYLHTML